MKRKVVNLMAEEKTEKKMSKEKKSDKRIAELETLLADALKQADVWKNKYYLAYADTENLHKQYEKEHQQFIKYRAMGFVDRLLPILDGFHMALSNEVTDPTLKNYLMGFQYIYKMMVDALEQEGVTEINPQIGEKFDEKTMEAFDTEESDGEENLVLRVFQKGYCLKDRIVRHARVIVSKKPVIKEENEGNLDENKDA